jgi:hypothetical protein
MNLSNVISIFEPSSSDSTRNSFSGESITAGDFHVFEMIDQASSVGFEGGGFLLNPAHFCSGGRTYFLTFFSRFTAFVFQHELMASSASMVSE